jgi:hypothetical protein
MTTKSRWVLNGGGGGGTRSGHIGSGVGKEGVFRIDGATSTGDWNDGEGRKRRGMEGGPDAYSPSICCLSVKTGVSCGESTAAAGAGSPNGSALSKRPHSGRRPSISEFRSPGKTEDKPITRVCVLLFISAPVSVQSAEMSPLRLLPREYHSDTESPRKALEIPSRHPTV